MRFGLILGLFVMVGCVAPKTVPAGMPDLSNPKEFNETDRDACAAAGGTYEMAGRLGWFRCTENFSDAGKACRDSSDCLGQCLTNEAIEFDDQMQPKLTTGTCAPNDNPFGCYTMVENGMPSTICVD